MINVHVFISGKVQGVWYRAKTKNKAKEFGIKGWVRNTKDGRVEALFQGDEKRVDDMISWCTKGSPLAIVTDIEVEKIEISEDFKDFTIRYI